jgi:hypothetical protein
MNKINKLLVGAAGFEPAQMGSKLLIILLLFLFTPSLPCQFAYATNFSGSIGALKYNKKVIRRNCIFNHQFRA